MDVKTFEEFKVAYDYIEALYKMLVKIDALVDIKTVRFVDVNNESFEVGAIGPTANMFHDFVRNHILAEIKKTKEFLENLIPTKASIIRAIEVALKTKADRGWDKTYWFFDLHGTILQPNYKEGDICTNFYPNAKEVLQALSKRTDIVMVMYTCSHPHEIEEYVKFFASNDIHFDYINENPEVEDSKYGFFGKKPYMNVLFEDKAGFNAENDWTAVQLFLTELKMYADKNNDKK